MKYFSGVAFLLTVLVSVSVNAQPKGKTITQLVNSVGEAFASKSMAGLDADKPYVGHVTVVIQHSLGGKSVTRSFASFAKVDKWLKSREKEDLPTRNSNSLKRCKSGVCTYDVSSLLHNNLYIKRVTYGTTRGRPHIKAITLLDGD